MILYHPTFENADFSIFSNSPVVSIVAFLLPGSATFCSDSLSTTQLMAFSKRIGKIPSWSHKLNENTPTPSLAFRTCTCGVCTWVCTDRCT